MNPFPALEREPVMSYDVLTYCDSCGELKFCRQALCDDGICDFCRECDVKAGGDAAAAVEGEFENAYPDLKITRRRALDLPPGKDEERRLDAKPELFSLGRIVATRGALALLAAAAVEPAVLLARHAVGDWGDVSEKDWKENEISLNEGFLIISSYRLEAGKKAWIVTEADRSITTLLLPQEY